MLPDLEVTDIFRHTPDGEGFQILESGFGVRSIPRGIGVYCLYHPTSGIPMYIGSGCGVDCYGRKSQGLFLRVKLYVKPHGSHDRKIHEAVKSEGLLLKVWLTSNEGDARKYEADAINLYKPPLNVVGCRKLSEEGSRLKMKQMNKDARILRKETQVYNPDLPKKCGRCQFPKLCRDFRRSAGRPLAVVGTCKKCEAEIRANAAAARKAEAARLGISFVQRQTKLGPTQALVLRILQRIGKGKAAAISTEIYGDHAVQHITNTCYALYRLRSKGAVVCSNRVWSATPKAELLLQPLLKDSKLAD